MTVYLIGNTLVDEDSLPLKLRPYLKEKFPLIHFQEVDPTENFVPAENSIIIDTVVGLKEVTLFNHLEDFVDSPRISPHDYDLLFHLKLLKKLGKIENIKIIGVPQDLKHEEAVLRIEKILKSQKLSSAS